MCWRSCGASFASEVSLRCRTCDSNFSWLPVDCAIQVGKSVFTDVAPPVDGDPLSDGCAFAPPCGAFCWDCCAGGFTTFLRSSSQLPANTEGETSRTAAATMNMPTACVIRLSCRCFAARGTNERRQLLVADTA